ncbi:MAG: hypothetical protein M1833_007168 [Piccolia ochrophora]|nr:MAG: hypothetical protein M1833_007168 [Piccolia ochrophora]
MTAIQLTDLPTELLVNIATHLPLIDLSTLIRVSHRFHTLLIPQLYQRAFEGTKRTTKNGDHYTRTLLCTGPQQSTLNKLVLYATKYRVFIPQCSASSEGIYYPNNRGLHGALHHAAQFGHLELVRLLVEGQGCDVNDACEAEDGSPTPLFLAVCSGDREVVRYLLKRGAKYDPQYTYRGGFTSLLMPAARPGRDGVELVKELLQKKGAIKKGARRQMALSWALFWALFRNEVEEGQRADLVRCLTRQGARVNDDWCKKNIPGFGPLHLAVSKSDEHSVKVLLEAGGDPNWQISPTEEYIGARGLLLHEAASQGDLRVVELLLKAGAKINAAAVDWGSLTPLMFAINAGQVTMARYLIRRGADIQQKDETGRTPLSVSVDASRKEVTRLLIRCGAKLPLLDVEMARQYRRRAAPPYQTVLWSYVWLSHRWSRTTTGRIAQWHPLPDSCDEVLLDENDVAHFKDEFADFADEPLETYPL